MPSFKFKKNLLITLIIIAVILLAANILLQSDLSESEIAEVRVDKKELSKKFRNILTEFGIEDKLIKETKSVDKRSNHKISNFKIQVPKDLSIPEILLAIYQSFRKDSLTLNSIETIFSE